MVAPILLWLNSHARLPHNLGLSGMAGELRTVPRLLRNPPRSSLEEVTDLLARMHGVSRSRIFVTHGATEGAGLVLQFLGRTLRVGAGRAPRARIRSPEYPFLPEVARLSGFHVVAAGDAADIAIGSCPNNPEGRGATRAELDRLLSGCAASLIDETFLGFSSAPSLARLDRRGLWLTGTLTKLWGADHVRVGWVIPPETMERKFRWYFTHVADGIAGASVDAAATLLAHRREVARESRGILGRNNRELRRRIPSAPLLDAPVWFDRGEGGWDGDRLASEAARAGVLVCPGSLFGDPSGVRICLTRRSFPRDLAAYVEVRERFLAAHGRAGP